jgi:DNA-binding GntR family transcriptional regulator
LTGNVQTLLRQPKESAKDYALRVLQYNILRFHLAPGAMISASELAEISGISRTPAREAMQELSKSGVLEIYPQAGSRISYLDYEKIHECRLIRLALETLVVEAACERLTPVGCQEFEDLLHLQENCLQRGARDRLLDLDDQFHRQFYVLTGKLYTYQFLGNALIHFDRVRRLSLNALSELHIVKDHRDIFAAVRAKDKPLAVQALRAHLSRYLDDEKIIRNTYPGYFKNDLPRRGHT